MNGPEEQASWHWIHLWKLLHSRQPEGDDHDFPGRLVLHKLVF